MLFEYKLNQFGLKNVHIVTDLITKSVGPISSITVTKISRHFTYKMAAKNGGLRYETKLPSSLSRYV